MGRLFITLLSAALALSACATKEDRDAASSGQTTQAGGTDLGAEAEREEARIRAGGSATSQSR